MLAYDDTEKETIVGFGNLSPRLKLKGDSHSVINETIYYVARNSACYSNRWSMGLGDGYNWMANGRYSYGLSESESGYYYYNRDTYLFESLGASWNEAAANLVAKRRAEVVTLTNIDQMVERRKPKPKPNRTGKSLKYGVNL